MRKITVSEAFSIAGGEISLECIRRWCRLGEIESEKNIAGSYLIFENSFLKRLSKGKNGNAFQKKEYQFLSEPTREMTKEEAERWIKVEEARAKNRENLIVEGKLISLEKLDEVLLPMLSEIFSSHRAMLDRVAIELSFSSSQSQILRNEYEKSTKQGLEKIKNVFNLTKNI